MRHSHSFLAGLMLLSPLSFGQDAEIGVLLKVGPEALHNGAAAEAVRVLSRAPASVLPALMVAMNSANELSANYLRAAVDTVVGRCLETKQPLPIDALRAFLLEASNNPRARRLAYEIMVKASPSEAAQLLPSFANDPSVELRYDAVQLLIGKADALKTAKDDAGALAAYQHALVAARDEKQIYTITTELRAMEVKVDLPTHFGFLAQWQLIGPFDNTQLAGFDTVFPPETEIKLDAEYEGKTGKVRWMPVSTGDDYGKVDLNPALGELKEVTGYATTVFNSPVEGPAELRLGCKNGWKVWLNGRFVFGRDEYHRGTRIDQYRLPVELKKGSNTILLKLCQNADVKDWTREWEFQLRVCDASGTAILATDRPPTPDNVSNGPSKAKTGRKK